MNVSAAALCCIRLADFNHFRDAQYSQQFDVFLFNCKISRNIIVAFFFLCIHRLHRLKTKTVNIKHPSSHSKGKIIHADPSKCFLTRRVFSPLLHHFLLASVRPSKPVSRLIKGIVSPPDAEMFMPPNRSPAFNERQLEPHLRRTLTLTHRR